MTTCISDTLSFYAQFEFRAIFHGVLPACRHGNSGRTESDRDSKMTDDGEEDRISGLPDCLLHEILSRLPSTKEAIRTATLCKRWKHLWTWVTTLIFQDSDYFLTEWCENPNLRSDVVSFVDKTLTKCRQLKLKRFEVHTSYHFPSFDIQFLSQFNNWIRYALSCNVEELNLKFFCEAEPEFLLDQFLFINSCFTDLTLEGCILNPIGAISWKNLWKLRMTFVKIEEDLIENILCGSPQLETLVLEGCYGYRLLNITSKSVKTLVFSGYSNPVYQFNFNEIIEINAPNILSLTIKGPLVLWKYLLVNVSSVVEANLDYYKLGYYETTRKEAQEEMLKGFILNLLHIKDLKIGGFCSKVLSRLEAKGFLYPSILKFPEANCDWFDTD